VLASCGRAVSLFAYLKEEEWEVGSWNGWCSVLAQELVGRAEGPAIAVSDSAVYVGGSFTTLAHC